MSSLKRHFMCTYWKWFGVFCYWKYMSHGFANSSRAWLSCRVNCCCCCFRFRLLGQLRARKMNSPRWLISFAIRIVNLLKWNRWKNGAFVPFSTFLFVFIRNDLLSLLPSCCVVVSISLLLLTQIQCYFHISIPITHLSPSTCRCRCRCWADVFSILFRFSPLLNIIQNVTCFRSKQLKVNSAQCARVFQITESHDVCVRVFVCV